MKIERRTKQILMRIRPSVKSEIQKFAKMYNRTTTGYLLALHRRNADAEYAFAAAIRQDKERAKQKSKTK